MEEQRQDRIHFEIRPDILFVLEMAFFEKLMSRMLPLIEANDRIRDALGRDGDCEDIKLASIAVIGNQSSGKSSIIERLSRMSLPRGQGMVTRCALVMELRNCNTDHEVVGIKFNYDAKYTEIAPADVAATIMSMTDEIAPGGSIASDKFINLRVTSRHVPDLTVIDLPGIVYSDVNGGRRDLFEAIKALYLKYIMDESCIILIALPVNVDLGTQEACAIAHAADPKKERTFGVITKIDLLEVGDGRTIVSRLQGEGQNSWNLAKALLLSGIEISLKSMRAPVLMKSIEPRRASLPLTESFLPRRPILRRGIWGSRLSSPTLPPSRAKGYTSRFPRWKSR